MKNPNTFARLHRVPTVAADEPGYNPAGEYWRGSVWAPTDTMVIRGLERYGYTDLAREIALNHLTNMGRVFEKTGTVWENYAPDKIEPGQPAATISSAGRESARFSISSNTRSASSPMPRITASLGGSIRKALRLPTIPFQRPHSDVDGGTPARTRGNVADRCRIGRPL